MLQNPEQIGEGIAPNKMFQLEEGVRPQDFIETIDLGNLPAEAVRVWDTIKNTLREAADINEIGLGQFAPKGRTSATEITQATQSSSALIRSIAHTIETHYLDNQLDLCWQTGLQHVSKTDEVMQQIAGKEMFEALMGERKQLIKRPITFQARGISSLIQKAQLLQSLLQVMQVMASNEILLREFLQVADVGKLVDLIIDLSGIDKTRLQLSERERLIKSIAQPIEERQNQVEEDNKGRQAGPNTQKDAIDIAEQLGLTAGGGGGQ